MIKASNDLGAAWEEKKYKMWNGNSLVRFEVSVYDAIVMKVL